MSILVKFKQGIGKSSKYLSTNILKAITNKKIDETILQEIEDIFHIFAIDPDSVEASNN